MTKEHTVTCYELLDEIRQKPGMYLGYPSITRFEMFLGGFLIAKPDATDTKKISGELRDFNQWLANRFEVTTSHGWSGIILFMADNSEEDGFRDFWILWNEFQESEI